MLAPRWPGLMVAILPNYAGGSSVDWGHLVAIMVKTLRKLPLSIRQHVIAASLPSSIPIKLDMCDIFAVADRIATNWCNWHSHQAARGCHGVATCCEIQAVDVVAMAWPRDAKSSSHKVLAQRRLRVAKFTSQVVAAMSSQQVVALG